MVRQLCKVLNQSPDILRSVGSGPISADRIIIRELRSELLPGRTLWHGRPVGTVNVGKTLKKIGIKGQRPLVVQILAQAPPATTTPALNMLRIWAHRRLNPLGENVCCIE